MSTTLPGQSHIQSIPWLIPDDKSLIVVISSNGPKEVKTIAETLCSLARVRGVTEARMVDHTLEAKFKDGSV